MHVGKGPSLSDHIQRLLVEASLRSGFGGEMATPGAPESATLVRASNMAAVIHGDLAAALE
jgi:hypothetical protein